MRSRSLRTLVMTAVLVVVTEVAVQAQERARAGAVQIQTQQLPRSEKVAVRERPSPRLVVAHIAHTPAPAKEGQAIAIEIKVENEGTAPSSGQETLHFECQNQQSGGPACPFGPDERSLPVIHSLSEPYPTGPYAHSVQLLTVPGWKAGSYQLTAWIVVPGSQFSETFFATIQVQPKLKLVPEAASQIEQALPPDESEESKFQIDPKVVVQPVGTAGPVARGEEEPEEKTIICPECFNPQPEPPGFTPDPPPDDAPFNPAPPPPGEVMTIEDKGEAPQVETPDLLPELKMQGNGVLFPLQIRVRNQGAAPALASRTRVTWYLTCKRAGDATTETFPIGPRDQVYSVPAIAANQSHDVSLTGPKQYCEAPRAAISKNMVCAGQCQVRALADTDGLVAESDEINNSVAAEVKRK